MFGRDLFYISILGTPSEKQPWMLQFGGHHLALNVTIAGEHGVLTPTLTGAQPALYTLERQDRASARRRERQGARAAERARRGPAQAGDPRLSRRRSRARARPGRQDDPARGAEGVGDERAAARDAARRDLRVGGHRARERGRGAHGGDQGRRWTTRGSRGAVRRPSTPGQNITAYYRIQGPKLVIEYAPQRLGGDLSMHVHTMYRDPTNDYGRKLTAR